MVTFKEATCLQAPIFKTSGSTKVGFEETICGKKDYSEIQISVA